MLLLQVDEEIRSLRKDLQESRQETENAQKQADKYQKSMNELTPMVKKLAADFSADPEQTFSEATVMESAKSYREKKAKPLVKKIVQVMRSVYSAYLDISNKFTKLQVAYNRERGNKQLINRPEESWQLRIMTADFGCTKAVVGSCD